MGLNRHLNPNHLLYLIPTLHCTLYRPVDLMSRPSLIRTNNRGVVGLLASCHLMTRMRPWFGRQYSKEKTDHKSLWKRNTPK